MTCIVSVTPNGNAVRVTCGIIDCMLIEVLVVPDCPNAEPAVRLVNDLLSENAVSASVVTVVVSSEAQAQELGFTGSPTFRIDGVDSFAQDGTAVGLACRVYRTRSGLVGLPDRDELAAALMP